MSTLKAFGMTQAEIAAGNAVAAFAAGLEGRQPEPEVVDIASSIANAALSQTLEPEITLDVDGALSFDLRLGGGHLILAELSPEGALDASVYDLRDELVQRMPFTSAAELIARFQG